jgi:hypothetical protein
LIRIIHFFANLKKENAVMMYRVGACASNPLSEVSDFDWFFLIENEAENRVPIILSITIPLICDKIKVQHIQFISLKTVLSKKNSNSEGARSGLSTTKI